MSDFRQLKVWQKAHALALRTYAVTKAFPREEVYGLTSQLRRATVSVGSNLAEGTGRGTKRQLAHFVRIALGSAHEVQYQFLLAADLGWITREDHSVLDAQVREIRAMLDALQRSLGEESGR